MGKNKNKNTHIKRFAVRKAYFREKANMLTAQHCTKTSER